MSYKYFIPFNTSPTKVADYYSSIDLENLQYFPYFGFNVSPLPESIYMEDPLLSQVNKQFEFLYAGIIKMSPWSIYTWHTDTQRTAALNMLLTANDSSYSIFNAGQKDMIINTIPLNYNKDTLYVFNTQEEHMVFNTHEDRYLFSIEFKDPVRYIDIIRWGKQNNLID